jgi:hypothetical protein
MYMIHCADIQSKKDANAEYRVHLVQGKNLNIPEPTFPRDLPVCLFYLGVVCKPIQICPCMGCVDGRSERRVLRGV